MIRGVVLCLAMVASPALADFVQARDVHILPRYAAFADSSAALSKTLEADCSADAVMPAYHAAYDDWIRVSHIQFGPAEARGVALSMSFWPDPKDRTGRAVATLVAETDPVVMDAAAFAQVSVAAQGFPALERLLTEPPEDAAYACDFMQAIATFIADVARDLESEWRNDFGETFVTAGADGNRTFQSDADVQRALFTSVSTALEFLHDQRLGRPLGTFDRPRPKRAEARRSDRSLRHIVLTLASLQDLVDKSFGDLQTPDLNAAFEDAIARAETLEDPTLAGVADPARRFKVEVLQRAVRDIRPALMNEVGAPLGISAGFNSLDGD